MAYWQPLRGIQDPISIRQFGGVYKPDDPGFNLSDSLFTELVNFCPDAYPALTTRPGYTVIGSFTGPVLGLGAWKDNELHMVGGDGVWRRYNGSTWDTLASGLNTTADWSFTNFKGNLADINLIGTNGVDPMKRYDGSTVQDVANAPAGANYVDTQYNRLYCAVGFIVKYGALRKVDDWTTVNDAGEIAHETPDGELINGLKAGSGNVTLFKGSSTAELLGTGPSNYKLNMVAGDIGAASNKAVTLQDDYLPLVSRNGIYEYAGGLRPSKDYSQAVNNFIKAMNRTQLAKCVSGSDGRYLYFAIPYGDATQVNLILQYDTVHGAWYTWEDIAATQMIRIGDYMYVGDAQGRVLRLGGTTDAGAAIHAVAVTKPFTAASIARRSHWHKLWVVASIPTGSTINVYVCPHETGEDWSLAKTLTADTYMRNQKILIQTNRIARAEAVRIKIEATGPVTLHEITRQVRELPMG
jgi:hypothetical protein